MIRDANDSVTIPVWFVNFAYHIGQTTSKENANYRLTNLILNQDWTQAEWSAIGEQLLNYLVRSAKWRALRECLREPETYALVSEHLCQDRNAMLTFLDESVDVSRISAVFLTAKKLFTVSERMAEQYHAIRYPNDVFGDIPMTVADLHEGLALDSLDYLEQLFRETALKRKLAA